jgi:hypothetical protein
MVTGWHAGTVSAREFMSEIKLSIIKYYDRRSKIVNCNKYFGMSFTMYFSDVFLDRVSHQIVGLKFRGNFFFKKMSRNFLIFLDRIELRIISTLILCFCALSPTVSRYERG